MTRRAQRSRGFAGGRRRSAGATLIEVLVSMAIITVGLLGVAGLQMTSLKNSYASFQRTLASAQAQDAVERLWAAACPLSSTTAATWEAARTAVLTEWQAQHNSNNATRLAMAGWVGTISPSTYSGFQSTNPPEKFQTFTIEVKWNDTQAGQGAQETFMHFTRIPKPVAGC